MAKVLFNSTNEEFRHMYGGVEYVIPPYPEPGHKKEFPDNCANFLLNALQARGLQALVFGDEGKGVEEKAEIGRRKNREFKELQVMRYNDQNEEHRQTGRKFIKAPPHIKKYAEELGVTLIEPVNTFDPKNIEKNAMQRQLDDQAATIKNLTEQLTILLKQNPAPPVESKEDLYETIKENRKKYSSLTSKNMPAYISNNVAAINSMPKENRIEIKMRWEEVLKDEPFPDVIKTE